MMSRTKIYARMEDTSIVLIGSNAYTDELSNFGDGVAFCKPTEQFGEFGQDQLLFDPEVTELDFASLFEGSHSIVLNDVNNVNSNGILDTSLFEKDYTLDEIMDDSNTTDFSGSETMSPYIGTPVPSPLSSVVDIGTPIPSPLSPALDMSLEVLLNSDHQIDAAQLLQVMNANNECQLKEENTNSFTDVALGSPDSGISSSDEFCSDTSDLILQLFGANMAVSAASEETTIIENPKSEIQVSYTEDRLHDILKSLAEPASSSDENYEKPKKSVERAHPYKRKGKTEEQKQRKKAQNRNAAVRYRSKKKDELKIMLDEEEKLQEKNTQLKGKVQNLRKEVDYLKTLMLDVIKARLAKGQKNSISLESLLQSSLIQS